MSDAAEQIKPEQFEPDRFAVYDSYKSKRNTALARALHPIMSWQMYDRFSCHRWALKLIAASPASGREAAAILTNFNWMVEGALASYDRSERERKRYDAVFAAFSKWKSDGRPIACPRCARTALELTGVEWPECECPS